MNCLMKKIFKVLTVFSVVFLLLTSCSNVADDGITVTTTSTTTTSATEHYKTELHTDALLSKTLVENITSTSVSTESEITKTEKTEQESTAKTEKSICCTIEIDCSSILKNMSDLKSSKVEFVPTDGKILSKTKVELPQGSTAFDLLKETCKNKVCDKNCQFCLNNGIHIDYSYTPAYNNYYVRGLHQLYEKDCGTKSGWMYRVNGIFPNYGSSSYILEDGDVVEFIYTCDLGDDIK